MTENCDVTPGESVPPASPAERVERMVETYLAAHPEFEPLEESYMHPSVLALTKSMKPWMIGQCGGPLPFWMLMLDAARLWFPDRREGLLGRVFCNRFEAEANICWNGLDAARSISRDYLVWIGVRVEGDEGAA